MIELPLLDDEYREVLPVVFQISFLKKHKTSNHIRLNPYLSSALPGNKNPGIMYLTNVKK